MSLRRLILLAITLVSLAGLLSACGSKGVDVSDDATASVKRGATLFAERCAGCHSMDQAGAQGSATKVSDRERVDGPNISQRKVCFDNALYALQNGGYSGAIMPANIVVGRDAEDVARFIAVYSGSDADAPPSPTGPPVTCPDPPAESG